MRTGVVYMLVDPRDGSGRYIGRTVLGMTRRINDHITLARRNGKSQAPVLAWVRELDAVGLRPEHLILEVLPDGDDRPAMDAAEVRHITQHRADGYVLLNVTPGGMGGPTMRGRKASPETIEKMRLAVARSNPSRSRKVSESKKVLWQEPDYRERALADLRASSAKAADMARGKPGRPHTEETKEKLRITSGRFRHSEESRRRISETLRSMPEATHPSGWSEKVHATNTAKVARHLAGIDRSVVTDGMTRQEIADALGVTLDRVKVWRASGILTGGKSVTSQDEMGRILGTRRIFTRDEILMIFEHYLGGDD